MQPSATDANLGHGLFYTFSSTISEISMSYAHNAKNHFSQAESLARQSDNREVQALAEGLKDLAQAIINMEYTLTHIQNDVRSRR
jgi:hypothetical protein